MNILIVKESYNQFRLTDKFIIVTYYLKTTDLDNAMAVAREGRGPSDYIQAPDSL